MMTHDDDYEAPVLAGFLMWFVILLLICTALWWAVTAVPAHADPVTLQFSGTMSSGTGLGTFTYDDIAAVPHTVDFGGMSNRVYTPFSWDFRIVSDSLPSQTFSSSIDGQIGNLCVGVCTAFNGGGQQLRLDLLDGAGLRFHFSFALTEPVATVPAFNQIGSFNAAQYRDERFEGTTRLAVFQTAALTQVGGEPVGSVPVPDMALLTGIMGVLMIGYRVRKELNHGSDL